MTFSPPEEWRPVPSRPGVFASSLGRVRLGEGQPTFGSAHAKQKGRRYVSSRRIRGRINVARAVCEAFNGPCPPGLECLHGDEDCTNNAPSNLRWGTRKENLNAPGFIAYCRSRTGENSPVIKGRAKAQAA